MPTQDNREQPLLKPYTMGDLELPNRVVFAPVTRCHANNPDNAATELMAEYYAQRATAGLIIAEGSQISAQAVGYINTPGIYTPAQIAGWKQVTDAVHIKNGRIFLQLWHVGRISHPDFYGGRLPLAPSAVNPNYRAYTFEGFKETVKPKAMTLDDIDQTILDFGQAAKNSMKAGFDGVEIHASNGYLLHQFLAKCSNIRTDDYGGSIEKRARILIEVLDEVRNYVPENRIGIRFNPSFHKLFGMIVDEETIPTFDYIVQRLNEYDLAYLHFSEPFNDVSAVPGAEIHIAQRYRSLWRGTLMINNNFDRETGNQVIDEDMADLVSYGRLYISNPDLVNRFARRVPLADWDDKKFYTPGPEGYTDYPTLE